MGMLRFMPTTKKKPTELAHSFLRCSCVCFCHYDPFNCILFHKFSWHLSCFSLCSSSLISALLVLSTIYHFMESLIQPWYNSKWLTGFKIAIYETNSLRASSTVFLGLCLQDLSEIRRCRAYFKKKKKNIYLFILPGAEPRIHRHGLFFFLDMLRVASSSRR